MDIFLFNFFNLIKKINKNQRTLFAASTKSICIDSQIASNFYLNLHIPKNMFKIVWVGWIEFSFDFFSKLTNRLSVRIIVSTSK